MTSSSLDRERQAAMAQLESKIAGVFADFIESVDHVLAEGEEFKIQIGDREVIVRRVRGGQHVTTRPSPPAQEQERELPSLPKLESTGMELDQSDPPDTIQRGGVQAGQPARPARSAGPAQSDRGQTSRSTELHEPPEQLDRAHNTDGRADSALADSALAQPRPSQPAPGQPAPAGDNVVGPGRWQPPPIDHEGRQAVLELTSIDKKAYDASYRGSSSVQRPYLRELVCSYDQVVHTALQAWSGIAACCVRDGLIYLKPVSLAVESLMYKLSIFIATGRYHMRPARAYAIAGGNEALDPPEGSLLVREDANGRKYYSTRGSLKAINKRCRDWQTDWDRYNRFDYSG